MSFPQAPLARLFGLYQSLYVVNKEWPWVHTQEEIDTVANQWCDAHGVDHEAYFKALNAWYHVDPSVHPLSDYLLFEALCYVAGEMEWYNLYESLYSYKVFARYIKAKPAS